MGRFQSCDSAQGGGEHETLIAMIVILGWGQYMGGVEVSNTLMISDGDLKDEVYTLRGIN